MRHALAVPVAIVTIYGLSLPSCGADPHPTVPTADSNPPTTSATNPLVVLPNLDNRFVASADNPSMGRLLDVAGAFVGLADNAVVDRLDRLLDTINAIESALTCAYREERVGLRVYQDRVHTGSLGLAVAIRGGAFDAVLDVAGCVLVDRVEAWFDYLLDNAREARPAYGLCVDIDEITHAGERFTVIRAGTTDWMCLELGGGAAPRSTSVDTTDNTDIIVPRDPECEDSADDCPWDVLRTIPDDLVWSTTVP